MCFIIHALLVVLIGVFTFSCFFFSYDAYSLSYWFFSFLTVTSGIFLIGILAWKLKAR